MTVRRVLLGTWVTLCAALAGCGAATGLDETAGFDGGVVSDAPPGNVGTVDRVPDASPLPDASLDADASPLPDASAGLDAKADAGFDAVPDATFDAGQEAGLDAGTEAGTDGTADAALVDTPRPIAPLSTSRVTSRRPTLHWALPPGVADATVDLCLDRACTNPIGTPALVAGTSYAPPDDLPVGVVYWRLHPSTQASLTSPTWEFTVGARTAPVDTSWGTTLDVNGDGYADIAVAAVGGNDPEGAVYLYLGGPSGLATAPAATLNDPGSAAGFDADVIDPGTDSFGGAISSAGDVNGDGYADLVVGAMGQHSASGEVGQGIAYIYLGSETGLAMVPSITLVSPCSLTEKDASCEFAGFGNSVASTGDVNGDGYADVVIGSNATPLNGYISYLYLGSESGLGTVPAATLTPPSGNANGGVVAGAGDVNGDGYGDVVLADCLYPNGPQNTYVFLGSAAGLATSPATTLGEGTCTVPVTTAGDVNGDGYADILVGPSIYLGGARGVSPVPALVLTDPNPPAECCDGFGISAACAGDVNGDGYADLVVGAFLSSKLLGNAYVYFGGASGLAAKPAITLKDPGDTSLDGFGFSVASAGDVNGDSYADIIVGAAQDQVVGTGQNAPPQGSVYVYPGTRTALASTPTLLDSPPDAGINFGVQVCGATN